MMRQRHGSAISEHDPETQVVVETIEPQSDNWAATPEPAADYDYSKEFANSSAIRSAFSLDNKKTTKRFRRAGMILIGIVAFFVLRKSTSILSDWWSQEPKLPYRACEPLAKPCSALIEELISMHKTTSYICSTQNQRFQQPCVCCILGKCWRDIRIVENTTVDPEEIRDRVDGKSYFRHIPRSSQICYKSVASDNFDTCEQASGKYLNAILRAIEKLRGWAPAGELNV